MRFLVLSEYFSPEVGATQVRLGAMCRELVRAGHEVEVVTGMPHHPAGRIFPGYRGRFTSVEFQGGVKVRRTWLYAATGSGWRRILNYLSFMLTSLYGVARARRPDYIFVDSPPLFLGISGWLASLYWRRPFIFNVADLWPDSVRDLGILDEGLFLKGAFSLENWIYRRARFVNAVTRGIEDVLLKRKGVPREKVLFLPNGVDTSIIQPLPADLSLKRELGLAGKRVAIYAGNHGYAAGAEQILHAASLLGAHPDIHFLFVGDGPDKPRLQQLARDLGLANVTFLDTVPLDRLPSYLALSEIAVVTLRKAGVTRGARPAKAFVMMAAAKPIVLAAEGEAEELIHSSDAGLIVPPDRPELFAAAILSLFDNPQGAREMGARGLRFVRENFEWSSLVGNWLRQLRAATDPRAPRAFGPDPAPERFPQVS